MQISNSIVLVTGANRGTGREYVRQLLERGAAKIYAAARDVASLDAIVLQDPDRIVPIRLDITKQADIDAAAQAASDVTLLINNAGVLSFGGALDVGPDAIEQDMSVNYRGLLDMTRAFAPVIERNGGGTVVNMLSLLSFLSAPGFSAYNASKAAAWSMTMSLRAYLAPRNIEILNAFPAGIDTDMLAAVDGPKDSPHDVVADVLSALERGEEDVYPAAAGAVHSSWRQDPKAVEKMLATMM
ncbi:SDR family oxidoreductase [Roseibium sp.]|uniref:SDR family oxidoreductase n=1 Tax=Roseibium sp. TaxID=1936156 RepID=UPI003A980BD1